ncbi:MAG TPA: hypothetical protein VL356_03605 [Acidocella sp.]|nr:hypothetical protein [Acidocella sp.]
MNKKKQKNFIDSGPWALSAPQLRPSIIKVFAPLFSKSGHFLCREADWSTSGPTVTMRPEQVEAGFGHCRIEPSHA